MNRALTLCSVLLPSITLILLGLSLSDAWVANLYHSDALYLRDLTADMLGNGSLDSWILTPAPYYFPDMALYLAIAWITESLPLQVISYASIQCLLLVAALRALLKRYGVSPCWAALSVTLLLAISAGLPQYSGTYNPLEPLELFYQSAHHFSAFVFALLFYALLPGQNEHIHTGKAALQVLLVLLLSASDMLYCLMTVIPWGIYVICSERQAVWRKLGNPFTPWPLGHYLILLVIAMLSGLLLKALLTINPVPTPPLAFNLGEIPDRWLILQNELALWFGANIWTTLLWALSTVALVVLALNTPQLRSLLSAIALATALPLLAQLTVIQQPAIRYLPLLTFAPILLLPLITTQIHSATNRWALLLSHAALVSWLLFLYTNQPAAPALTHYYPNQTRCLDQHARTEGLHTGISNYWNARHNTALSQTGVNVLPVTAQFTPYEWIINLADYRRNQEIQFVMTSGLDTDQLLNLAGEADKKLSCPGTELWLYTQNQLKPALAERLSPFNFATPGDTRTYTAPQLQTASGTVVGNRILSNNQAGTLMYGPYQQVKAGRYQATVIFSTAIPAGLRWDALLHSNQQTQQLGQGEIKATQSTQTTIELQVTTAGKLEVRLFNSNQHQLQLKQLQLVRLN